MNKHRDDNRRGVRNREIAAFGGGAIVVLLLLILLAWALS